MTRKQPKKDVVRSAVSPSASARPSVREGLVVSHIMPNAVLDGMADAVFALDAASRITYLNRAAEQFAERSRDELMGQVLWEALPKRSFPTLPSSCAQARVTGQMVLLADASPSRERWWRVQISPGGDSTIVVSFRDVTDLRRLEDELAEIERRFRTLFAHAAVGMAQVGLDGRWLEVNDRLCALVGYTREDLLARTFQDITHPDDLAHDLAHLDELVAGQRDSYAIEKRYVRPDGAPVWVQLIVALVRDAVGEPEYFVSVIQDISARKQTEEALRASEERLQLALDASSSGTFVWYPGEDRTASDPQMLRLFGLRSTSELTLAQAMATMIHAADRERYAAAVARAIDPQGIGELREDIRVMLPDGSERCLAISGRTVFGGEPRQALHMIGTAMDITERKRAEEALRESEARFRLLADNMSQLVWMAHPTGERFWYNRRWYDYTGTTLEEMQRRGWTHIHHPDHVQRMLAHMQHAVATGEPWEDTFPLRGQDGTYRWFLTQAVPARDERGAVVRWFGTNTDIEEARRLQEELATTLDTMGDAVVLIGHAGEVVRTNPACFQLLQIEASPDWQAVFLRSTVAERNALMRSATLSGRPLTAEEWPATRLLRGEAFTGAQALEYRLTGLAGRQRVVRVSGVPLLDAQGQVVGGVEVLHDITDRYEQEQERAQMLNVVAHELRTPVTSLKMMVQMNERRLARGVPIEPAHVEVEARAVRNLERMVNDLLDAARADTAHVALQRAPTDLAALCEQVASEQSVAAGRGIDLELPTEPVVADVDSGRISQVVGNLLSNALKYSPSEATVTLRLRTDGDEAVLTVQDTGPGIPPEALPRLFERFYRAPGAQVLHGSGVGLGVGLYLCQQFVERHGGTISVESEMGVGTTFTVKLPLTDAAVPTRPD